MNSPSASDSIASRPSSPSPSNPEEEADSGKLWYYRNWSKLMGIGVKPSKLVASKCSYIQDVATKVPSPSLTGWARGSGASIPMALNSALISGLRGVCGRRAALHSTVIKFRSTHASVLMSSPEIRSEDRSLSNICDVISCNEYNF